MGTLDKERYSGAALCAATNVFYLLFFFFWYLVIIKRSESREQFHTGTDNILLNADVPLAQNIIWQPGKNRLFAMGSVD